MAAAAIAPEAGPPVPPSRHPEWPGSVSDKWMDRRSAVGARSCRRMVDSHLRDGAASVARLGLGGYMRDTSEPGWPEGRSLHRSPEVLPPPPMELRELQWRPSRRLVVPPHVVHREKLESTKLTEKPPYVKRPSASLPNLHPRIQLKRAAEFGHLGLDKDIRRVPLWVKFDKADPEWWDAGPTIQYGPSEKQTFGNAARKEKLREITDYWEPRVVVEKGCKFIAPATKVNHDAFLSALGDSLAQPAPRVVLNRTGSSHATLPGVLPPRKGKKLVRSGYIGDEESVRMLPGDSGYDSD